MSIKQRLKKLLHLFIAAVVVAVAWTILFLLTNVSWSTQEEVVCDKACKLLQLSEQRAGLLFDKATAKEKLTEYEELANYYTDLTTTKREEYWAIQSHIEELDGQIADTMNEGIGQPDPNQEAIDPDTDTPETIEDKLNSSWAMSWN